MTLVESVEALYRARPFHFLPYVGRAYVAPELRDLRVMTIGINAYASPEDWVPEKHTPHPEWVRSWFTSSRHRFDKSVQRDVAMLVDHLTSPSGMFDGLVYRGLASVFHTNAIKTYLPSASGKKADDVPDHLFVEHADVWRRELDVLATHRVLPHVIVVFGEPFWEHAWKAFADRRERAFEVVASEQAPGPCHHHVNRYRVRGACVEHDLLLVRVRHPRSSSLRGAPKTLLVDPDFRIVCGLDVGRPRDRTRTLAPGSYPAGYDYHALFDRLRIIAHHEGGSTLAADVDGQPYVVIDDSTLAEFADDIGASAVRILAFDSTADRRAMLAPRLREPVDAADISTTKEDEC